MRAEQHQLPELPEAVVISILQQIPLRDRLACCALVCKSWASAAACTAMDLRADVTGPEGCRQMQNWLEQSAGQVNSINLTYCTRPDEILSPVQSRLLLPCSKLTGLETLRLYYLPVAFHMQQGSISTRSRPKASTARGLAGSSRSSMAAAPAPAAARGSFLPALPELSLNNCLITLDSFLQLSQLSHLTSLHLNTVTVRTGSWTGRQRMTQISQTLLSALGSSHSCLGCERWRCTTLTLTHQ